MKLFLKLRLTLLSGLKLTIKVPFYQKKKVYFYGREFYERKYIFMRENFMQLEGFEEEIQRKYYTNLFSLFQLD